MSYEQHPEKQQLAPQVPAKYEPLRYVRSVLEYLGGARDTPPRQGPRLLDTFLVHAFSWVLLLLLVYFFCGQSSRFIYIDF